jgi:hypothetical protein
MAVSQFLINREQGDWAEKQILDNLAGIRSDIIPVRYGRTDEIVAGEPGFAEFYERYQDELDTIGKKPDTLLFKQADFDGTDNDISRLSKEDQEGFVRNALAALEVRSSSYLVKDYREYMRTSKKRRKRDWLSYTVKVEDLAIVLKWIETYRIPHFYVQVFFDSIYAIPFHRILEILTDLHNKNKIYTLERNAKNQFKSTIHIDIAQGWKLGEVCSMPQPVAEARKLERGRMLFYVKFREGASEIDGTVFDEMIRTAEALKA